MGELVPHAELDFGATVTSGQVFRFTCDGDVWTGCDGGNVIRAVRRTKGWELESFPDAAAYRGFLQLDKSEREVAQRIVKAEPRIAKIVARAQGLRLLRCADPSEVLFSFLCTPNNHMTRITRMVSSLGNRGEEVSAGHFRFADVEAIASIGEQELRDAGFGYRARAIVRAATQLMELGGASWLLALRSGTYEAGRTSLMQLTGVGPKVADCICLFGLHFDNSIPLDVHLWRSVTELYFPEWVGKPLTDSRYLAGVTRFVEVFGPDAGWAQQYLFYDRLIAGRRPS